MILYTSQCNMHFIISVLCDQKITSNTMISNFMKHLVNLYMQVFVATQKAELKSRLTVVRRVVKSYIAHALIKMCTATTVS